MTIFQLVIYSCVTAVSVGGQGLCGWDGLTFYDSAAKCQEAAARALMSHIGDVRSDVRVEKHKCVPMRTN